MRKKRESQKIIIKRSVDAPPDEALSFAWSAHEIGHLVKKGERDDARLDNFEATRAEEQGAWDRGWEYLQEYVDEYYSDKPECAPKIRQAFERIKSLAMQATDLSQDMYLENGTLDNLAPDEIQRILKERREKFFSERGVAFKNIFDKMKKKKLA